MNERLLIETPENLELQADIAGLGSRFLAALIDYFFIFVLMLCVTVLIPQLNTESETLARSAVIWLMVQFVLMTFYHLFFELVWSGQTPGKRRVGIRVVQSNGLPVAPASTVIRNLVRLFDFLPIFYGVGLIVTFATIKTQRLGDLAGRTIVIYENPAIELHSLKQNWQIRYHRISVYTPVPAEINIDMLTEKDRQAVVNFLQRRAALENFEHLSVPLARKIAGLMNPSRGMPPGMDAETFLEWVARAFELKSSTSL